MIAVMALRMKKLAACRQRLQYISQQPYTSINAVEQDLQQATHLQAFDVSGVGTSRGSLCVAATSTVAMVHA